MVIDATMPKGYKQTDIGVIPVDWNIKKLGDISKKITTGKLNANAMSSNGDYPFFTCAEGHYWIDKYAFDDEALLVSGNGANVGYIHYYKGKFNAYQRTYVLTDFNEDIWFVKLFMDRNLQERIRTEVNAGNTPYIKMDTLTEMSISIPPTKSEQIAIATALSDVDRLIAVLEKLIAKKRNIKQGAMQELLTGKKRLPGFSGKWEVTELGAIFSISAGGDLMKETFSPIKDSKYCYPIYSNSLTNKGLYGFSELYRHNENCITVTARGTIGVANARDHKFDAIGRVLILKPICELNCLFISEYLNHRVNFSIESTGVPQLTVPQISKYQIMYPTKAEQAAIAQVLSDMDAEIEQLDQNLDKYKMIKQGMMQELLTGKTRLI